MTSASAMWTVLASVSLVLLLSPMADTSYLQNYCKKRVAETKYGYYSVPGFCNLFVHCTELGSYMQVCASGTFYDGKACCHAGDVDCKSDPCRKEPEGHTYSDGGYCYGYYVCRNGKSVYAQCPKQYSFDGRKCVHDKTCNRYKQGEYGQGCPPHVLPSPGVASKFYLKDSKGKLHSIDCPFGLRFNPKACACDWGYLPPESGCSSLFEFDFSGNSLEKYNRVPLSLMEPVNTVLNNLFLEKGGKAIIWLTDDLEFGSEFQLQFDFQYLGADKGEVALVANDYEDSNYTVRISMDVRTQRIYARFLLIDGHHITMVVPDVDVSKVHSVTVSKFGEDFKLAVDKKPPVTTKAQSGVKAKDSPIVLGEASGCHGFIGFMDNIKLYRCKPDQQLDFQ